jgi:retinol dehydrogenase 14
MAFRIDGKRCLITGANTGIGKETAIGLAKKGARIVMVCRDRARGVAAQQEIRKASRHEVELLIADLSVQREVRDLAQEILDRFDTLPIVISNAGVVMRTRTLTPDGYEATFAINHLAPFLLINLLLERVQASAPARIVVVASQVEAGGRIDFDDLQLAHGYDPLVAYRQSKLANVLFTYELARKLRGSDVTANCLHPGVIATHLLCDYLDRPRVASKLHRITHPGPAFGAKTSIRLASDPALEGTSGRFFRPEGEAQSSQQSYDEALARRLWQVSETLTELA